MKIVMKQEGGNQKRTDSAVSDYRMEGIRIHKTGDECLHTSCFSARTVAHNCPSSNSWSMPATSTATTATHLEQILAGLPMAIQ